MWKVRILIPLVPLLIAGSVLAQTRTRGDNPTKTVTPREVRELKQRSPEQIQARIDKIEETLARINRRRTEHFLGILQRLREVLKKIEESTQKAKNKGLDVSRVETAIGLAREAINNAQNAVEKQQAMIYEIEAPEEGETWAQVVGAAMKELQEDLQKVRDVVKDAKDAVFNALQALKKIRGEV